MDEENALIVSRNELLFSDRNNIDEFLKGEEPAVFAEKLYFSPVPYKILGPYVDAKISLKPTEHEYKRFQLIKRAHMLEIYKCLGSMLFAVINIDAVNGMRDSRSKLEKKVPPGNTILTDLDRIIRESERHIDSLAVYPTNGDTCKAISDASKDYNSVILNKLEPHRKQFSIEEKEIDNFIVKYGATHHHSIYGSFEEIISYLKDAGFGETHFAWSKDHGLDRFTDFAKDTLKFSLSTRSKVSFHMAPRPNNNVDIRKIYNITDTYLPSPPLQPIAVAVHTWGKKSSHAGRLETAYSGVKVNYPSVMLKEGSLLIYCPQPKCMHGLEIEKS